MEEYMSKFNDENPRTSNNRNGNAAEDNFDDLTTELTPITSMENISRHPDHKIYHSSSKSSIKHILLNVTHRLTGLKANMAMTGNNAPAADSSHFGSHGTYSIKKSTDSLANADKSNMELFLQRNCDKSKIKNNRSNGAIMSRHCRKSLKDKMKALGREGGDHDSDSEICESLTGSSGFGSSTSSSNNVNSSSSKKIGARLAQCCEHSDYMLSKLLSSTTLNERPNSVMSASSTMTSSSSATDNEKNLLELPNNRTESPLILRSENPRYYRRGRKDIINQRNLYLSYIDQDNEPHSDSDASADSFYERSFEAIENLLESEMFPDSEIYSDQEDYCSSSNSAGSLGNNWSHSSPTKADNIGHTKDDSNLPSTLDFKPTFSFNNRLPPTAPSCKQTATSSSTSNIDSRRSRLIRSQAILEKLKHLEECARFQREELPSPSFEGIKSIQERRRELDLWKTGTGGNREDESETSSQHSTSTINTVIEMSSPSKSTSFPSSRRCSDTESSGGNSPLTERAISVASNRSLSQGQLGVEPMPKGWVKLLVGKLEKEDP